MGSVNEKQHNDRYNNWKTRKQCQPIIQLLLVKERIYLEARMMTRLLLPPLRHVFVAAQSVVLAAVVLS